MAISDLKSIKIFSRARANIEQKPYGASQSLYVLFTHFRSCDNNQESCFFQISSY